MKKISLFALCILFLLFINPALSAEKDRKEKIDEILSRVQSSEKTAQEEGRKELLALGKEDYFILKEKKEKIKNPAVEKILAEVLQHLRRRHSIWDFNPLQKAKEYLQNHPRKDISSIGGNHSLKVCKLLGENKSSALAKSFPYHKFYEFKWMIFSGRPDPRMYLAVSIDGDMAELRIYVDMGVDSSVAEFFKKNLAIQVRTSDEAVEVMHAYCDLLGEKPGTTEKITQGERVISTPSTPYSPPISLHFSKDGKLKYLGPGPSK